MRGAKRCWGCGGGVALRLKTQQTGCSSEKKKHRRGNYSDPKTEVEGSLRGGPRRGALRASRLLPFCPLSPLLFTFS